MDFLKEVGISNETVSALNSSCLNEEKLVANANKEDIISSINYLKSIGITDETIEDILVYDFHYLEPGAELLRVSVEKNGVRNVVDKINEDLDNLIYLKDF